MDYDPNSKNIGDYRNFIEKNIASLNNKDHCDPKERNNDHICFKFLVTSYPLGTWKVYYTGIPTFYKHNISLVELKKY